MRTLRLSVPERKKAIWFGMTWGWVNYYRIFISSWTILLNSDVPGKSSPGCQFLQILCAALFTYYLFFLLVWSERLNQNYWMELNRSLAVWMVMIWASLKHRKLMNTTLQPAVFPLPVHSIIYQGQITNKQHIYNRFTQQRLDFWKSSTHHEVFQSFGWEK